MNELVATCSVRAAFDVFLQEPGRSLSTKKKYRTKFRLFLAQHGNEPLTDITHDVLEAWFEYLKDKKGYSNGHLSFHRSCHVAFFNYCSRVTGENPASKLPRYSSSPAQIVIANRDDVEQALKTCERMWETLIAQRDAAIFAFGTAGLRRSNIRLMRYSITMRALENPVQIGGRTAYLIATEGKQSMEAVLDERRGRIVRRYITNRPPARHDRLFVALDTKHYLDPLSNEGLKRARVRVCQMAGVKPITFQKMRRLVGTQVARSTSPDRAARVLGHKSGDRVIIDHYYDPDKEAARLAALDVLA